VRRYTISMLIGAGLAGMVGVTPATALNTDTHEIINEQAVRQSTTGVLDPDEVVAGRAAFEWLREGGIREDDRIRFLRHFHDPLQPWDGAGLLGLFESSIRWMQRTDQGWSWQKARDRYHISLTAPRPEGRDGRERALADALRALGQQMHLVVDASVPEHVRNDPHPLGPIFGNYEYWVSRKHGLPGSLEEAAFIAEFLSNLFGPDPAILQQVTGDSVASVPMARLIDTNAYLGLGTGPNVTVQGTPPNVTLSPTVGIAEMANANFFSEDTGDRSYPFPDVGALVPSMHLVPQTARIRAYFAKAQGDGLPADPVLAECVLYVPAAYEAVIEPVTRNCTDENVWAQVAKAMLPTAVGYSAALLDYFFRGQLDVSVEEDGIRIENWTPDEAMSGTFDLYYETADGTRTRLGTWTLTLDANAQSDLLPVQRLPSDTPSTTFCVIVFRGQLGLEPDAVAGSVVSCPTETPPPPALRHVANWYFIGVIPPNYVLGTGYTSNFADLDPWEPSEMNSGFSCSYTWSPSVWTYTLTDYLSTLYGDAPPGWPPIGTIRVLTC